MDKIYGVIYKATNLVNKKLYIGQTTQVFEERIRQHKKKFGNDDRTIFAFAIKKYGFESFKFEIIDHAFSKYELDEKERSYIKSFNTFVRIKGHHGYNMTDGGEGVGSANLGRKLSRNHCIKIGSTHRGKILSRETKDKISKAREGRFGGENHPLFGTNLSAESKHKMSETQKKRLSDKSKHPMFGRKGIDNPNSKPVVQISTEGEFINRFDSITVAIQCLGGGSEGTLSACCGGTLKSYNGFIWIHEADYSKENVEKRVKDNKEKGSQKQVIQLSKDGNLISVHESLKEAERKTGANNASIGRVCKGRQKTSMGFVWMYKEDYDKLSAVS